MEAEVVSSTSTDERRLHVGQATDLLPEPLKKKVGVCDVVMVGGARAPDAIVKVLEKGPKYATKVSHKPLELLTIARDVGVRAVPANRDSCILDGVDNLPCEKGFTPRDPNVGDVVSFCLNERLKLLVSEKEGGFVLVPEDVFVLKGKMAVEKNFK